MASSPDAMDLPRPFGPYTLLRRLAVGGMAEVYVARARGLGGFEKLVAIKVIHPRFSEDEHFVQMLVEEAKISVLLTHVNIAQIFDLGCIDDTYCIVMEYIEGADTYRMLKRAADRGPPLPLDVCAYIASEVCNGLDYAHRKRDSEGRSLGIVHRDISPQNVLLSYAGEVKLVDFGIAKAALRTGQTEAGVIKGKYYYMSPEQAWGDPMDHRSDIFSAGVVLYELLTGEMLYQEDNIPQLLDKVRKADIEPPSTKRREIPTELDQIVLKAVTKRPEDRYQSAHELGQALAEFLYRSSPHFTAQRLADHMTTLFEEELRRYGASIGARTSGERRLPPKERPAVEDEPTHSVEVMQPDEFAPNGTKSVIFDLGDEEDATRNDVLPYRRRLELERQRAEREAQAAARRGPDDATAPVVSPAGGGNTRPLRAVRPVEEEPTLVGEAAGDDWDDATVTEGASAADWDDESTVVDESGEVMAEVRRMARSPAPGPGPRPPAPAPPAAPTPPRPEPPAARAAPPPPPPPPAPRRAEAWPVTAAPERQARAAEPWAAVAAPPRPPPRPSLWPEPAAAHTESEPPTGVWVPRAEPGAEGPPSAPPQAYPAVPGTRPDLAAEGDPFVARPPDLNTAGWAAMTTKRSYKGVLVVAGALVALVALGGGAAILFAPEPPPPVLEVISVPPGASVTLDGEAVPGAAPVRITEGLSLERTHHVAVSMPGYETWTTTFQPTRGLVKQIAVLAPERATLRIESEPPGAHVWVDGVLYGSTPLEVPGLPIGREVQIRASRVGHREARETVRISADQLSPTVTLRLEPEE